MKHVAIWQLTDLYGLKVNAIQPEGDLHFNKSAIKISYRLYMTDIKAIRYEEAKYLLPVEL